MKEKIISIILIVLIVFILFVITASGITINKYNNISKTIDKDIETVKRNITEKEKEYKKIKDDNKVKNKQIENMTNYIDTLNEKVKEYEK